ncbi:phosphohistidine phosphatase SixA [Luteolibacter sp. LG18]|uniref:phosphohistidine phosphatase SixA n=1 Tax=Luteolibacter sp. LG18 TaxID=2819286 RepID=UPI002B2E9988|nr:phosphohistidine phosphatase SixA [Luteolibacter sp. LG18]
MELILLRHGKAEDHGHPGGDGERALVEKGYEQARRAGELAKAAGFAPDLVLTSPLVRARQTAETFCEAAGIAAPLIQPWIACGMRADTALNELRAFSNFRRVAIVGHEPDLSSLIEFLLGASGGAVDVKKGALACLDVAPSGRRGRLLFLIPPKLAE